MKEISFNDLSGKVVAIDASIFLYQFLTTIRSADGQLLMDSKGQVTSHLVGLFSRTTNLMQKGIKPVYVFDGKVPLLKQVERDRRKELKIEAERKYQEAVEKEDVDEMKKYAARTTRLTSEMVVEAKELLYALGVPVIEAASEGEAQAAYLVKKGDAFCVASQDADCLMFGATRLVKNLSIAGRKKKAGSIAYTTIEPEIIFLDENLSNLGISHEQLIALCMMVGTDYNPGGIKGIGPKNALKLVRQYGTDFDRLFNDVKWGNYFSYNWKEVYDLIINIPVSDDYTLKWWDVDINRLKALLVDKHDFSNERVDSTISKLIELKEKKTQKSLFDY